MIRKGIIRTIRLNYTAPVARQFSQAIAWLLIQAPPFGVLLPPTIAAYSCYRTNVRRTQSLAAKDDAPSNSNWIPPRVIIQRGEDGDQDGCRRRCGSDSVADGGDAGPAQVSHCRKWNGWVWMSETLAVLLIGSLITQSVGLSDAWSQFSVWAGGQNYSCHSAQASSM